MKLPAYLPTVFAFGIVAAALAVIAAVLPARRVDEPDSHLSLGIEYVDPIVNVTAPPIFSAEAERDNFVNEHLPDPEMEDDWENIEDVPTRPIVRMTTPDELIDDTDKLDDTNNANEDDFYSRERVTTDTDRLVQITSSPTTETVEDESITAKQKAETDEKMRASAIAESDLSKCNEIVGERTAEECRNTIYFKKAVAEVDLTKCDLITSENSKSNCQSYVTLILKNAD